MAISSAAARSRLKRRKAVHQTMSAASNSPARNSTSSAAFRAPFTPAQGANKAKSPHARRGHRALLALLPQLVLASINVNGLSPETEWAVTTLLEEKKYDVSLFPSAPL